MFILPIYEEQIDKMNFPLYDERSFWVLNYHSFLDDIIDQVSTVSTQVYNVGGFKRFTL